MDEESEEPILLELLADRLLKTGPDPAAQALSVVRFFEQHGVDLYPEPPLDPEGLAEIEAERGNREGYITLEQLQVEMGFGESGIERRDQSARS